MKKNQLRLFKYKNKFDKKVKNNTIKRIGLKAVTSESDAISSIEMAKSLE